MKRRSFLGLITLVAVGTQLEAKAKKPIEWAKLPGSGLRRKPTESIGTLSSEAVKMFDKEVMEAYSKQASLSSVVKTKYIPGYMVADKNNGE